MAIFLIEKACDYTVMSKHLWNARLSPKFKGLLPIIRSINLPSSGLFKTICIFGKYFEI